MANVILANGEFPSHPIPLQALGEARTVYCCDGAIHKYLAYVETGQSPSLQQEVHVVGDCDSLGDVQGIEVVRIEEQDYNDLTKTVRYALSRGERDLVILGATGLREDHTLGNISLLCYYLTQFNIPIRMLTDHGTFTPIRETTTFASFPRQQVSIFSLQNQALITTHGLEHPLHRAPLPQWWMGTLNAALSTEFTLELDAPADLLVYQTHAPKA